MTTWAERRYRRRANDGEELTKYCIDGAPQVMVAQVERDGQQMIVDIGKWSSRDAYLLRTVSYLLYNHRAWKVTRLCSCTVREVREDSVEPPLVGEH